MFKDGNINLRLINIWLEFSYGSLPSLRKTGKSKNKAGTIGWHSHLRKKKRRLRKPDDVLSEHHHCYFNSFIFKQASRKIILLLTNLLN